MKILKEHMDGIVFCLFELVVGILLMFNPIGFTSGIIMIAGIVLMVLGLAQLFLLRLFYSVHLPLLRFYGCSQAFHCL